MMSIELQELQEIAARAESDTVEFKASTAQLPRAGETLCGMLNGQGGIVLIGVSPAGKLSGQDVSDSTQQEIARMLVRYEPPAPVEQRIVSLPDSSRSIILFAVPSGSDGTPYSYDGRAYQRIATTTSRM
ncbi:MAG: ATP-binding protein, partial [Betaproteobacteria bacterium]